MKKLFCLVLLTFISISCSNSDEDETPINTIDPTKLAKVILFPETSREKHWNFNENGLLKEITKPDGTIEVNYVYDKNNNVIEINYLNNNSITEKSLFTYDTNNYLTSNGISTYTYDATTNSYINHNSVVGPDENVYYYDYTYYLNEERLPLSVVTNFYPNNEDISYDYFIRTTRQKFENGNVVSVTPNDSDLMNEYIYEYDNTNNPLKNALLPISRVNFIPFDFEYSIIPLYPQVSPFLFSKNNVLTSVGHSVYESDEGIINTPAKYIYIYNSNNLPISMQYEYQSSPMLKYYYQGDVIPN